MRAADLLRRVRTATGWSQRELARRAGVAQPVIARTESGAADVRVATLDALVRACGFELTVRPVAGRGVDRGLLRALLALSPAERLEAAAAAGRLVWTAGGPFAQDDPR